MHGGRQQWLQCECSLHRTLIISVLWEFYGVLCIVTVLHSGGTTELYYYSNRALWLLGGAAVASHRCGPSSIPALGRGRMCEKCHQLLAVGRWLPPGTPVSSTR